jgi:hypothetical protein
MKVRTFLSLVVATLSAAGSASAQSRSVQSAPASAISAGKPLWVDTASDPQSLINARVDIGRLRQERDEIEAQISWPLSLALRSIYRRSKPDLRIPDGSRAIDRERIVCRPSGILYFTVENTIVAPDGTVIYRQGRDAAEERRKVEAAWENGSIRSNIGYGDDPRSLICWAAARKCEAKAFSWPPPPNKTPLERSERADRMRAAYYLMFVPACKL